MSATSIEASAETRGLGLPIGLAVISLMTFAVSFAFRSMMTMWQGGEYSHAWLIIPLAGLILVQRYQKVAQGGNRWVGIALALLAPVLMLVGWASHNMSLSVYAWILGLTSLVWASLGSRAMRSMAAPIAFLLFMIPLPLALYIQVSAEMQLLSSKLGVGLLSLVGVNVDLDGNVIQLTNGRLEVAQACNGLRYLFPLTSIAFLIAVLMRDRLWKKIAVVCAAAPIAVAMNGIRLALTGISVERYGIEMASGTPHEVAGLFCFALCIGVLGLVALALLRIKPGGHLLAFDVLVPRRSAMRAVAQWPSPLPFWLASIFLGLGALLIVALPARSSITPDRRPLSLFPMAMEGWLGTPKALDSLTLEALGLTDYVLADYRDISDQPPINFYVAYYSTQSFGIQVHSPRLCIPGDGWSVLSEQIVDIALSDGSVITANRAAIEKRGARQIVYFWFNERGRHLQTEFQVKLAGVIDALLANRSDGALVRLVTPVAGGDEAQADVRLRAFAAAATARLARYVPE